MLDKPCRTDDPSPCRWTKLWTDLLRWLRRRVRAPLDPEDIASETRLRALRAHGKAPALPWAAIWSWSVRTAQFVIAEARRTLVRIAPLERPDELASALPEVASNDVPWLGDLADTATPAQGRVLFAMHEGVTTSSGLACRLGCSVRAVEHHRAGLRRAALRIGIVS